jgi:hypothetical protein
MKHLLKTAVLLVIGFLAAQPVLSSLSCAAGLAVACTPSCQMATSNMAPDCPMTGTSATGMSASGGCPQNCCTQNSLNALLPQPAPDKSKVTTPLPVAILARVYAVAGREKPAAISLEGRADTPPRYILNRVFRI